MILDVRELRESLVLASTSLSYAQELADAGLGGTWDELQALGELRQALTNARLAADRAIHEAADIDSTYQLVAS